MTTSQTPATEQRRFHLTLSCADHHDKIVNRGYGTKDPSQPDPQVGDVQPCGYCGTKDKSTIVAIHRYY